MRKRLWWCLGGGVLLLAATFATAHFALRNPHSFVGQVAYTCSQAALALHPAGVLPSNRCGQVCPGGDEACEGPVVCEASVAELIPAAIHIPDEEPVPAAPMPVGVDAQSPVPAADLCVAQFPQEDHGLVAPFRMPYCGEELSEPTCSACEVLPMPKVAYEDDEEQEAHDEVFPLGGAHPLLRLFEKVLKKCHDVTSPCHHGCHHGHLQVDTMEHRSSDRPLQDYGKGPF